MRILIIRDPRENPKKCSLTPLRGRPGIDFLAFEPERIYEFGPVTLLDPAGPPLTAGDRDRPLLLLDCSWRRLANLRRGLRGATFPRAIPSGVRTSYPRRSKSFPDPENGLASVEALVAASWVLGEPREDLLDGYPWRDPFLERNRQRFLELSERS